MTNINDMIDKYSSNANMGLDQPSEPMKCPEATQDIEINLKNRQVCVDKANYGPANPSLENSEFWQKKADLFKTSVEETKTMRCSNCAAFIVKTPMKQCIEKGIGDEEGSEATGIINLANLGYCELFDFKCAGERTCDAWITGGPLTDEVK
jgi:hypothetical protein